jgi:tetratricopeptide (TPR) repeat protein
LNRLGIISIVIVIAAGGALAAMQRGPKPETAAEAERESPRERGRAAAEAGDCQTALPLLERAVAAVPGDAGALNLLAYCQRKSGRLDDAFANYRRALEIRPEFPVAREYLGEAHIQATLREIEILRSYGESGREELADLVAALREAADAAAAGSTPPTEEPARPRERW